MTSLSQNYEQLPPPADEQGPDPSGVGSVSVGPDPSVGELAAKIGEQVSRLVRGELALAQLEAKQRAKKVGLGAGMFGASGMLAFFGACCGVTAAILGLANVLRPWAAAIAVAIVLFVLAGLLALPGWKVLTSKRPAVPADSIDSVKADLSAVRQAWGSGDAGGRR